MRSLKGGIPRGYSDHRRPEARAYASYLRALVTRFGELPPDVTPLVREAGRLAVDLERLALALEAAVAARRRRDQARIRRQRTIALSQLLTLEQRLEERLARSRPKVSRLADHLRQVADDGSRKSEAGR